MESKIPLQDFTVPAGDECYCASLVEARNVASQHNVFSENINLCLAETDFECAFVWCCSSKKVLELVIPVFNDFPAVEKISNKMKLIPENSYIRNPAYGIYVFVNDPDFGQILRKIDMLATQQNILATMSLLEEDKDFLGEKPDIYLVRMVPTDNPKKILYYSWIIEGEKMRLFYPVFADDGIKYRNQNLTSLNWIIVSANETFWHNDTMYQLKLDENDEYCIQQICQSCLKIVKNP